jgi:cytochrome P450
VSALDDLDVGGMLDRAGAAARGLAAELEPAREPARLRDFALRLPVAVVAGLFGVHDDDVPRTAGWTADFAAGLAPGAPADAVARAGDAASALRHMFLARAETSRARARAGDVRAGDRFGALAAAAARAGLDDDVAVANAIGLLFQSYEATAALIANTVAALGAHAQLCERVAGDPGALRAVVREVVRWDAPVQNTRRFAARSGIVGGAPMKEGDAVLVILAAANRDPAANADPDRFEVGRPARVAFTFGTGPHACPGEAAAVAIATAGVHELLAAGVEPARLGPPVGYRRSVNVRMPLWGAA